jgi:uncharacterized repeat protein (TIGR01451 family)
LSFPITVAALIASLALCPAAPAQAKGNQSADRWVTIAARVCDNYTDIRANLARNNLMESLKDLGEDSLYDAGEPIDPRTVQAGQPNCRPLVGWRFTFGDGIGGRPVDGPWGSLSIVSDPDSHEAVTKKSEPARDFDGQPVGGGVKIEGAVTVGLNHDQAERAARGGLWLQGGTPTDPDLFSDPQFAGGYAFGALRCAIDDLNGDNVESIQFPAGTRHMYCFAYYVSPAPASGRIVIRKEVEGAQTSQSFAFSGNVSYDPGGAFDLSASQGSPGSTEFVRSATGPGEAPWTVVEEKPPGWTLTDISCESQASTTATDLDAQRVEIGLAAGDTATCNFSNRLTPPAGALVLRKVTVGGTGSFTFRVGGQDRVVARPELTTRAQGGVGAFKALKLDPGKYSITERRPATRKGVWRLSGVKCNGIRQTPGKPVNVNITAGRGAICSFTNRLTRPGRIEIGATTLGGLGTAGYVVTPAGDSTLKRRQIATTTRQGVTAPAHGQSTRSLPFGRYVIQETAIAASQHKVWSLIAVACNGHVVPFEQGRVTVRITPARPVQKCRFLNLRQHNPEPAPPEPEPNKPEPEAPPTTNPVPGEATPDLAVEKRLVHTSGGHEPILTYRLLISNRSAVKANQVVVADRLAAETMLVSADSSHGDCFKRGDRLLVCKLGDLAPHGDATILVRVRQFDPGAGTNVAVVGSSAPEDELRNNLSSVPVARIKSPPPPPPPTACPSQAPPVAIASC